MGAVFIPWMVGLLMAALASGSHAADGQAIPRPNDAATQCTAKQAKAAVELAQVPGELAACFAVLRWSVHGVALAVWEPGAAADPVRPEAFKVMQRAVYRDQSVRLRADRDLADALPNRPPAHMTIPRSLDVKARLPLGVFLDADGVIGFADLVPVAGPRWDPRTPLPPPVRSRLQMELLVLHEGRVLRLVLLSRMSGTATVGDAYRIGEDWADAVRGRGQVSASR